MHLQWNEMNSSLISLIWNYTQLSKTDPSKNTEYKEESLNTYKISIKTCHDQATC